MFQRTRVEVAEWTTADEFFRDAPENQKAELVDGVVILPSPPLTVHESLQTFLLTLLRLYVEERNLGEVLGSRTAVELDIDQVPEPDVLFVARDRLAIVQSKGVMGPPDLVVEILSAGTARIDRGPKFRAYQRAGVRELWLVDPYGPSGTEFFQHRTRKYVLVAPDDAGVYHSVAVPGFWIDTEWLWPQDRFIAIRQALATILTAT